jgi:hypothetical protein
MTTASCKSLPTVTALGLKVMSGAVTVTAICRLPFAGVVYPSG